MFEIVLVLLLIRHSSPAILEQNVPLSKLAKGVVNIIRHRGTIRERCASEGRAYVWTCFAMVAHYSHAFTASGNWHHCTH